MAAAAARRSPKQKRPWRKTKVKPRVWIRPPAIDDCATFLAAVRQSRSLHHPWVSPPATKEAYRRYVQRVSSSTHRAFLVVQTEGKNLVGAINLNNIIRGAFRNAFLGYFAFSNYERKGLMHEGMQLVLAYAFRKLKLHRLEANIQPDNRSSIALVQKCGFEREGFSRRYLRIAGRWRDHERWALCAEDFSHAATR